MKRFCIFAQRRTGSNLLVSLLNSHNEVNCFGEIFRNRFDVRKRLPFIDEAYIDHFRRINNINSFLTEIEEKNVNSSGAWGLKAMQGQLGQNLSTLIEQKFDAFIILRRTNTLAQFSSEEIAKVTGQGVAGRNAVVKTARIKFDAKKYQLFAAKMEKDYAELRFLLSRISVPILELEYKALQDPELSAKLCNFLRLKSQNLVSFHQQRNPSNILERFVNKDKVIEFIERVGTPDFHKE